MKNVGELLRELREKEGLLLREVAAAINIDPALLSKIERCDRLPTKGQINDLSQFYKDNGNLIKIFYLSDKLYYEVKDEDIAIEALKLAEEKVNFTNNNKK